jgi:hypothetical protein
MHDWQLGFWSNGSGKPPGFFQMRMKEDDARNRRVEEYIELAETRQIEKEDRVKQREKRWGFWKPIVGWVVTGFMGGLVTFSIWFVPRAFHVIDVLWHDYERYHPAVRQQLNTGEALPQSSRPQDARIPPMRNSQ